MAEGVAARRKQPRGLDECHGRVGELEVEYARILSPREFVGGLIVGGEQHQTVRLTQRGVDAVDGVGGEEVNRARNGLTYVVVIVAVVVGRRGGDAFAQPQLTLRENKEKKRGGGGRGK